MAKYYFFYLSPNSFPKSPLCPLFFLCYHRIFLVAVTALLTVIASSSSSLSRLQQISLSCQYLHLFFWSVITPICIAQSQWTRVYLIDNIVVAHTVRWLTLTIRMTWQCNESLTRRSFVLVNNFIALFLSSFRYEANLTPPFKNFRYLLSSLHLISRWTPAFDVRVNVVSPAFCILNIVKLGHMICFVWRTQFARLSQTWTAQAPISIAASCWRQSETHRQIVAILLAHSFNWSDK